MVVIVVKMARWRGDEKIGYYERTLSLCKMRSGDRNITPGVNAAYNALGKKTRPDKPKMIVRCALDRTTSRVVN